MNSAADAGSVGNVLSAICLEVLPSSFEKRVETARQPSVVSDQLVDSGAWGRGRWGTFKGLVCVSIDAGRCDADTSETDADTAAAAASVASAAVGLSPGERPSNFFVVELNASADPPPSLVSILPERRLSLLSIEDPECDKGPCDGSAEFTGVGGFCGFGSPRVRLRSASAAAAVTGGLS